MEVLPAIDGAIGCMLPGARVVTVSELRGGVSALVCAIEVETTDGETRRLVFRQHRSAGVDRHRAEKVATEFVVLRALRERGFPVPEVLHLDESGALTDPFFVMEAVDGSTEVRSPDVPAALEQMADFLAELHALDPEGVAVPGLAPLEDPIAALPAHLSSGAVGSSLRSAIEAGQIAIVRNRPVLLHGDYWPGNVLWRRGELAAVIDWEDCAVGDPLADLACARVELLCQYGAEAMHAFTSHYLRRSTELSTPLFLGSLPLWEVYVSATALSSMADWGLEPDEERRRRGATQEFFERAAAELLRRGDAST
jgi:aminoglycoside phosphotransferase (APT) family kinase protein